MNTYMIDDFANPCPTDEIEQKENIVAIYIV